MGVIVADFISFNYNDREVVMPDTGGVMAKHYSTGAFYEGHMLYAIEALARPGLYVDVGANEGNHSVFFEMFCPSTKVIAFEPDDYIWPYLMQAREANELSFEAHKVGLSDTTESVEIRLGRRTLTIQTQPLDDLRLDNVAVVKIDIEGMEPQALLGMRSTLAASAPHLFIEAHTDGELESQEAVVGPLGYVRTGRVWNASPTYEWVYRDFFEES
jgi:FkbM family methyltransferase